jgi:hypothetical protein
VDLELTLLDLQPSWIEELRKLAPFGQGNPRPTIALRRVTIEPSSARAAVITEGSTKMAVRGWFPDLAAGECYDALVSPDDPGSGHGVTVSDVRIAGPAAGGAPA